MHWQTFLRPGGPMSCTIDSAGSRPFLNQTHPIRWLQVNAGLALRVTFLHKNSHEVNAGLVDFIIKQ